MPGPRLSIIRALTPSPGTYVLVLRSPRSAEAPIGRWGRLAIRRGHYLYVGSAFGAGGVRARVARHCRAAKSKHWHIDYLREFATPIAVWYSDAPARLEHRWAAALSRVSGAAPIPGFGCSDCRCEAHLFFTLKAPEPAAFARIVSGSGTLWSCELAGWPAAHGSPSARSAHPILHSTDSSRLARSG
jgi:Uri superfamily endonuclease